MHVQDAWADWRASNPEADEATFHAGWNGSLSYSAEVNKMANRIQVNRVLDIFQLAPNGASADDVMQDILIALNILEIYK